VLSYQSKYNSKCEIFELVKGKVYCYGFLEVAAVIKCERGITQKINFMLAASVATEMNLLHG